MIKTFQELLKENKVKNIGDIIYYDYYECGEETKFIVTGVKICCVSVVGEQYYYVEYLTEFNGNSECIIDCLGNSCIEKIFNINRILINKGRDKNDG